VALPLLNQYDLVNENPNMVQIVASQRRAPPHPSNAMYGCKINDFNREKQGALLAGESTFAAPQIVKPWRLPAQTD
jgi:hypothetical protein